MEGYHVFDSEEISSFTACPTVECILPGHKLNDDLIGRAFAGGLYWSVTNSTITASEHIGTGYRYLRIVKVKIGPLKSRLRLWSTQNVAVDDSGATMVAIHGFDERENCRSLEDIPVDWDTPEQGIRIVYEERVSTSASVVALASKKMRAEHRAVLDSLVDRIESDEGVVVEPVFPSTTKWQDIDREEAVYSLQRAVPIGSRKRKGGSRTLHNVFAGNEAVDAAVQEWGFPSREEAFSLLADLMDRGYFFKADKTDTESFEDNRSFYSWSAPIEVAIQEFVAPVRQEIPLPAQLPDRDSWPLYFVCALVASNIFVSLPSLLVMLLFAATFYFAFARGKRIERNKLLALVPQEQVPIEWISETPVTSRCLLSVNGESTPPNGHTLAFENEYCTGKALLKTRTQPVDPRVADYFRGKNRMFELQCQFKLKEALDEDEVLYVGGETKAPLSLSVGRRFICATIINALKLFNKTLHFSFGKDGENAHLCFPFRVMPDDLIVTPPGQEPPDLTLGYLASGKAPTEELKMEVGYTYTLAFYSQYLDLERWTIQKLPGLSEINLSTFWQENSLYIVGYRVKKQSDGHSITKRKLLLDIELVHDSLPRYQELTKSNK